MNILFLGSSDFVILPLKALSKTSHNITLITKPDKPKGRGLNVSKTPLKLAAEELKIPIFQPDELFSIVSQISPELIVVVAYGRILSGEILSIPRYGACNLHPSLLPKYRGAAPISWALINGEEKTGVTVFFMDETMDGGDIILQREVNIFPDDDYESLSLRLSEIGGEVLIDAISLIEKGCVQRKKQIKAPTFAPKIKEPFYIDFRNDNKKIFAIIRGIPKDPGVWIMFNNERVKILKARIDEKGGEPGKILGTRGQGIVIGCGNGSIVLDLVQKQSKKPISGLAFLCGIKGKKG